MANPKSKRRSRKPRHPAGSAPKAVPSQRRETRAEREAIIRQQSQAATRTTGSAGDRPPSPFGGLPISEFAIFVGLVSVIIGIIAGGGLAIPVGAVVCGVGVTEVTAREHLSGFRSHSTLLAAIPAVIVEVVIVKLVGVPRQRILILVPVIPVFALGFWFLRRNFASARHARVTRPPSS